MHRRHQALKRQQKQIAMQRIETLERLAEAKAVAGDLLLAQRYLQLARSIATRLVVPVPSSVRRRVCRQCGAYLLPGVSSRTRIHRGRIIVYCTHCHAYSRYPLHHKTSRPLSVQSSEGQ